MKESENFTIDQRDWDSFWGTIDSTRIVDPTSQRYFLIGYTTTYEAETTIRAKSERAALQILADRLGCNFLIRYAFPIGE